MELKGNDTIIVRIININSLYRGASSSNIVIVTANGEIISRADGLGTNHWVCLYVYYNYLIVMV